MHKLRWLLLGLFALAFLLRMTYSWNLPLSGDEGISLIQAAGQATEYNNNIPLIPTSIQETKKLIEYSPEYTLTDVCESMEKEGMHPPFYYLFLHYVMKYCGNEIICLRFFSVLFSSLSVVVLYLLAKDLFCPRTGLAAASLLAVCPYGIHYATMVRPYPLLMLLSLLSTWLLIRYRKADSRKNRGFFLSLYLFTVMLGFYSIYIFLFVFIFQLTCLLVWKPMSLKNWLQIIGIGLLVSVLYLPWLPSFCTQMDVVQADTYYFHGHSNPVRMLEYMFSYNFTEAFPGTYAWYKFLILAFVGGLCIRSLIMMIRQKVGLFIIIAFVAYVTSNFLADLIMQSATLNIPKFLFFLIPVFLLLISAGISCRTQFHWGEKIVMVFLVVLLAVNSLFLFQSPKTEDGRSSMDDLTSSINRHTTQIPKNLIILNTRRRRFVLSFVHRIQSKADLVMLPHRETLEEQLQQFNLSDYDQILFVAFENPDFPSREQVQESIEQTMDPDSWNLISTETFSNVTSKDTLLLYHKQPMPKY